MKALADVEQPDSWTIPLGTVTRPPLPTRTPRVALAQCLAGYPGMELWRELRELLPADSAARVLEAAATAYRAARQ
ncbi:hypothetical protein J2S48_004770 [Promicromonospora iranensis]|uniref:Uncharacterized protein n=1 Tax=Promicromonospora iranensis TaxID=1105144 RepID=A0ABU2CV97_9MICO|nr:hypothetical protein [Promicromonospora iranensis]